jgi:hypothetical protein
MRPDIIPGAKFPDYELPDQDEDASQDSAFPIDVLTNRRTP